MDLQEKTNLKHTNEPSFHQWPSCSAAGREERCNICPISSACGFSSDMISFNPLNLRSWYYLTDGELQAQVK